MGSTASKEKRQHGSAMVPYSYYKCRVPEAFPMVPLHWHNEFELSYVVSGKGELVYNDERIVTNAGDIIVIPPNVVHAIYPHQDFVQVYDTLVFKEMLLGIDKQERCGITYLEPIVSGSHRIIAPISAGHSAYASMQKCVKQIFACVERNEPIADLYMKSELLRFFALLEENGCVIAVKNRDDWQAEGIRRALVFINENYREMICVEQLADIANLSRSYFMYRFKQMVGVSAMEYVIQLRIRNACELLRGGSSSIEAAFASGFQNMSNFNRQFKKCVGCTPGEFRRER